MKRRACDRTDNAGYTAARHPPGQGIRPGPGLNAALSATRHKKPRSLTTTTASSWTTASRPATRRTPPSSHQRSPGSRGEPAARPARSPPTAATASPRPSGNCRLWGYARSPSRAGPGPQPPAVRSSMPAASASWSNGEPAAKAGSAISNAGTAGTAPGWTAARELPSGAGTGYSATTWSRSAHSPADPPRPDPRMPPTVPPGISLRTFSGRSKLERLSSSRIAHWPLAAALPFADFAGFASGFWRWIRPGGESISAETSYRALCSSLSAPRVAASSFSRPGSGR